MSNKDRMIAICFCFCLAMLFSCKDKSETKQKQLLFKKYSIEIATETEYNYVYLTANDTVNSWVINNLEVAKAYKVSNWRIDSLLCFNKVVNKCVLCIYRQYNEKVNNAIDFIFGVKINNNWYFFEGACIYIFSENYGYDPNTPLSFEKLHEIAMKEVFSGYLIEKKKDLGWWRNTFAPEYEYEINEDFFKQMTSVGFCSTCTTEEEFEQAWLGNVRANWER